MVKQTNLQSNQKSTTGVPVATLVLEFSGNSAEAYLCCLTFYKYVLIACKLFRLVMLHARNSTKQKQILC